MSKSILVIDTPKSCVKCPLIKQINTFIHQGYNCSRNDKKIEHILEKPDWCPLLDLPEKKEQTTVITYFNGWNNGFNACIDEILKGANGNE